MAGSISDFRSSFYLDVARPSRFDVILPPPLKLMVPYAFVSRNLMFRCEVSELPGRTFGTLDRKIYGPIEKHPYVTSYNEVTMTFLVSEDMSERVFFDAWMELINPRSSYDFNYKSEYSTRILINQYNSAHIPIYSTMLIDAFPISMNQMDLDWSNENSAHKLTIVFAYHTWEPLSITGLIGGLLNSIEFVPKDVGQPNIYNMQVVGRGINDIFNDSVAHQDMLGPQ